MPTFFRWTSQNRDTYDLDSAWTILTRSNFPHRHGKTHQHAWESLLGRWEGAPWHAILTHQGSTRYIHQRLCSTCQCCHHGWLSKTDTTAKCHSREPINQRDSTGQTGQPTFAACTASKGTLDTCENASHYYAQLTHQRITSESSTTSRGVWMERVIRGT
ncbi:hypothetical protein Lal_00043744 [Lupinus albus]|nr:hypothetical protein Lal_00043744 [Lupinus albus]